MKIHCKVRGKVSVRPASWSVVKDSAGIISFSLVSKGHSDICSIYSGHRNAIEVIVRNVVRVVVSGVIKGVVMRMVRGVNILLIKHLLIYTMPPEQ